MNLSVICSDFTIGNILMQPWVQVHEIANRLGKRGVKVTIITNVKQNQLPKGIFNHSVDVKSIEGIHHVTLMDKIGKDTVLSCSPDMIFLIGSPISSIYMNRLGTLGIPIIWNIDNGLYDFQILSSMSLHDIVCPHHRFFWYPTAMAGLPRMLLRRATSNPIVKIITVPTNYLKECLIYEGVDPRKIAILSSAVELDSMHSAIPDFIKPVRHPLVLYFGSPCTLRGTDTLIRSMEHVVKEHDEAGALLLSRRRDDEDDREERYIKRLISKLGLDSHVMLYTGILPRKYIASIIKMSDIVSLPFKILFNDFPLSVYEAMKFGKPVVTTTCGSLKELSRRNAVLAVKPGDHESLGNHIKRLIEYPDEAEELATNGRRVVNELPSWEEITDIFLHIIDQRYDDGSNIL